MTILIDGVDESLVSSDEIQARSLLERGKVDEAIAIFDSIRPESARILLKIGSIYADRKGDYRTTVNYYTKALQVVEKNGDDVSHVLTELGFANQNLGDCEAALNYHFRALGMRKLALVINKASIANSLIGIANAYWGLSKLSDALSYAQQAIALNESIGSGNEMNLAANFAILANIYHSCGDDLQALEISKKAVSLLELYAPSDSLALAAFLNNLGTIQFGAGLLSDAQLSFARALLLCEKCLPEQHPKRLAMESNVHRITEIENQNALNLRSSFWNFSWKALIS